ncbi:MAG: sugar transferase [Bacteroidales bacterium]|nr:sugar transferase [Bacteroidales bacterium]
MLRFFDIVLSFLAILILLPLFFVFSVLIIAESKGGAFYKQIRIGKNRKEFKLLKFRSMKVGADKKGLLTIGLDDNRITKTGKFIRKYKIDELPQLFNVLKGDMSFVGPRPEVKKYVDLYSYEQQKVLNVRPGITDFASVQFFDENNILANAKDPEKTYTHEIMPQKIKLNMTFIENPSVKNYFTVIFKTFLRILK